MVSFVGSRALRRIYRRTILGWLWLFINPLFPLTLRILIFGILLGVPSNGIPYPLFLLAGSLVWDTFSASLTWATRALEMNRHLTEQVYLPRALLPFGNVTPALLDFAIVTILFMAVAAYYNLADGQLYVVIGPNLLWAFGALALVLAFALALSFFTSVWGETGRDMRFALAQLLAVWYLLTPVLYPLSAVPPEYRAWMLLNPLAIIVETFKWGLFGVGELHHVAFGWTALVVLLVTLGGITYFSRAEAIAVDQR